MGHLQGKTGFTGLALVLGLLLSASVVGQQTAVSDPAQVEFDAAFEAMLEKPADIETILRYSRAATAAGDYESAIGALERLLLINSNLPVVRADLGLLYYRLESYEVARFHLNEAVADADKLPAGLRKSVNRTLGRLDKRITRSSVSGVLSLGLRYQTNANAGPESNTVLSLGAPILLDDDFQERDDYNAGIYGRIRHEYDLRTQNHAVVDTVASLYVTRHDKIERLNSLLLEVTPGVRFKPDPADHKGFTLRPHLIARIFRRDGDRYSDSFGLGLDARYRIREDLTVDGTIQYRDRDYKQSSGRPRLNQRDGDETNIKFTLHKGLWRGTNLLFRVDGVDRDTRQNFRDSHEYGLLGRLNTAYTPLFGSGGDPWRAYFSLGYRNLDYQAADPAVDPGKSREDHRWKASLGTTIPVTEEWDLRLGLSRTQVNSNIRNFDRRNTSVDMNAVWRF